MSKRILSVLLSLMLVVAVFTGCNNNGDQESGNANPSSKEDGASQTLNSASSIDSSEVKAKGKFDDVRLKMLVCWNGGFPTASDQYNNEVATAIRDEIGVTVEYEGIMMSEVEKLNLMFASGDMPDIINAPYWGGTAGETAVIKKAGVEGRLLDIKDKVQQYENIKDAYDLGVVGAKYLENDIHYPEFGDAVYILPQEVAAGVENTTNWAYGVFVRGDVPKALGIDEKKIKTSEELYDFMVKARDHGFKDANGNDTIVATTYHEGWDYTGYFQNFKAKKLTSDTSGYYLDKDGKVAYEALSDGFIEKNLFLWKMVKEDLLDKECFKHTDAQADEKVGNGTALFASSQYSVIIKSTELTGLYQSNPEMRYTWVGPLNFSGGESRVQVSPEGRNGSPALLFPTTCSNLDAALTYIDYLNSEEGARLAQYGIEGVHYELNADGQPRMNKEWTEKVLADGEGTKEQLREFGIGYMAGRVLCADKRMSWWGERDAFEADAQKPEMKEYKELVPVEVLKGYSIDGIAPQFERYAEVSEIAWEGTTERDYRERAYFAATEEEARQILKDYQNYLLTSNNGVFKEYMEWMNEQYKTRDDFVF